MNRQRIGRIAGMILALLGAILMCAWALAADTPIVILDGSLTMESPTPWNQFTGSGDRRNHPNAGKSVTSVTVTMPGKNQTVSFNNQQCTVDVTYASTDIQVSTGTNGKGLRVAPFSAFQDGGSPTVLAHKNQNAKISHVTVTKAGVKAFDSDASGGTKIVIHYQ